MFPIRYSLEASEARRQGRPFLALESTIITHGMPYPQNIEMVNRVEAIAREGGVCPVTMAVLDGEFHIGLDPDELERLAKAKNPLKLSRGDLPAALAQKKTGATTVAATMIMARHAGIDVFATGGIGGVHRGAETSFDISADLRELAETPVITVCAGAKAILDLPKTFEYLETMGVSTVVYGADEIPAFYSRASGLDAPIRMDNADDIASTLLMREALALPGGILVANPIPKEHEIPASEIAPVIEAALARAAENNIHGKAVTPFLLDAIFHATKGKSLEANIALVENNVRLATQIARTLAEARKASIKT